MYQQSTQEVEMSILITAITNVQSTLKMEILKLVSLSMWHAKVNTRCEDLGLACVKDGLLAMQYDNI